jgi:hypothetical protein
VVAIMEGDMSATGLDVFHHLDPRQIEKSSASTAREHPRLVADGHGRRGRAFRTGGLRRLAGSADSVVRH